MMNNIIILQFIPRKIILNKLENTHYLYQLVKMYSFIETKIAQHKKVE